MYGLSTRALKTAIGLTAIGLLSFAATDACAQQACPPGGSGYAPWTMRTKTGDSSEAPPGATGDGTRLNFGLEFTVPPTFVWYCLTSSVPAYLGQPVSGFLHVESPPREVTLSAGALTPVKYVCDDDPTGCPWGLQFYFGELAFATMNCFESICTPDPTAQFYSKFGNIWGLVFGKDGEGRDVPLAGAGVSAVEVGHGFKARSTFTDDNGVFTFRTGAMPVDDEEQTNPPKTFIPIPIPDANKWGLRVYRDYNAHGPGRSYWKVSTSKTASNPIEVTSNSEAFVILQGLYEKKDGDPNRRKCPAQGKPVSIMTGNVFLDQTDATLAGPRGGLSLERSYNSQAAHRGASGVFGRGWSHSWSARVKETRRFVTYIGPSGVAEYLSDHDDDGTFDAYAPADLRDKIVRTATGFRRENLDGSVEVFDAEGRLTSTTDLAGASTSLTYDGQRLVAIQGPGGRSLSFAYSADRVELSGPAGLIATYDLVGGDLGRVTYADGTGYRYEYDADGQLLLMSDLTGRVIERHTYDGDKGTLSEIGAGQERYAFAYAPGLTTVTDGLGNVTRYEWEEVGENKQVTRIEGPCSSCGSGSEVQVKGYDSRGRLTSVRNGLGEETTFHYDGAGNLDEFHDASGRVWRYEYDSRGRLTKETGPDGAIRQMSHGPAGPLTFTDALLKVASVTYTPTGQVETITDRRGKVTTFSYYPSGDLQKVRDPLVHETAYEYDAMGRRTKVTTPAGSTRVVYDAGGRVRRVEGPEATKVEIEYDRSGRLEVVKDALGRATRYGYDAAGRMESTLDPQGGLTGYGYDAMSRLTSLTDAKGQRTAFEYDGYGRVARTVYPGGGAFEGYTYDGAGRLKTKTDRKSVVTTYSYDGAGRLTGLTFSDGTPAVAYTYDTAGRLWTAANGSDSLTFSYDPNGRLLSEASSRNASMVSVTYDDAGNRLSLSLDGQLHLSYGWDDDGRLESLTQGSRSFGFGYDAAERRTSLSYPNGVVTSYAYDGASRLTRLRAVLGAATITDFGYGYDVVGNRLSLTRPDGVEGYGYDALDRLVRVDRTSGATRLWSYGYDAVGNRLTDQAGDAATTSSYDVRNQLLGRQGGGSLLWRGALDEPGSVSITSATVNGKPARMLPGNVFEADVAAQPGTNDVTLAARDARGNLRTNTYEVEVPGSSATYTYDGNGSLETKIDASGSWSYEWNALGQLVRVLKDGTEVARFAYDPLGRRVEKAAGGSTTAYTYDGMDILRERVGETATRYVHGPGIDEPLAREVAGAWTYLHADALGSIRRGTDGAGQVVLERDYDAWGTPLVGAEVPGYAYTGREWDPEAGLYYYRARYYDPGTGTFTAEDPIGFVGGLHRRTYAANAPVNLIDPSGLTNADFGGGWSGRVDSFPTGTGTSFEIHVYNPSGAEAGVLGPKGWIAKHGSDGTAPFLPDAIRNKLNGRLIEELRRHRMLPPKGRMNIKAKGICGRLGHAMFVLAALGLARDLAAAESHQATQDAFGRAARDMAYPLGEVLDWLEQALEPTFQNMMTTPANGMSFQEQAEMFRDFE